MSDLPTLPGRARRSDHTSGKKSWAAPRSAQDSTDRKVGLLDDADDLELFGSRVSHSRSPPTPVVFFLRIRFSRVRSATTSLRARDSARRSLTSVLVLAGGIPGQAFLPGLEKLFRPAVIQALGNALSAAQLCNAVLAAKPGQDDTDFLFGAVNLARCAPDV